MLREQGTVNRLAWLTPWPENRWLMSKRYAGYVAFREEGCRVVSLSGAPLARSQDARSQDVSGDAHLDRGTVDAFLDRLSTALEPYYGFRSLHAFKAKFRPRLEPLFLVFADETDLPRIGLALSRAYLPAAGVREYVALARAGRG